MALRTPPTLERRRVAGDEVSLKRRGSGGDAHSGWYGGGGGCDQELTKEITRGFQDFAKWGENKKDR
jgi:hypothetical protein